MQGTNHCSEVFNEEKERTIHTKDSMTEKGPKNPAVEKSASKWRYEQNSYRSRLIISTNFITTKNIWEND